MRRSFFDIREIGERNVEQKRSILTGTIITLGTIVLVLSMALSKIVAEKMTRAVVENMTGDIQIHNQLDFKISPD